MVTLAHPPTWLQLQPLGTTARIPKPRAPRELNELGLSPDLSRLPAKVRRLVRHGNRGEYPSRSEADWAVCIAMFRAGYGLDEIWTVMTSPENAISEKFFEKGDQGEAYLELTINKAHEFAKTEQERRGRVYARRRGGVSID